LNRPVDHAWGAALVEFMATSESDLLGVSTRSASVTAIGPRGLVRFLHDCGHAPRTLHLADIERDAAP
jgi:hypothetical protein